MNKSLLALTSAIILTQTVAAMDENDNPYRRAQIAEYERLTRLHQERQNPQEINLDNHLNDVAIAQAMFEDLNLRNDAPQVTEEDMEYMRQLQNQFGSEVLNVPQVTDEDMEYMRQLQNQFGGNAYYGNNVNFGGYQPQQPQIQPQHNIINNAPHHEQFEQMPDEKTMIADGIMNRFMHHYGDMADEIDLDDQATMRQAVQTLISTMKFDYQKEITPQEAEALINEYRKQYQ